MDSPMDSRLRNTILFPVLDIAREFNGFTHGQYAILFHVLDIARVQAKTDGIRIESICSVSSVG
jgi:hypothetical protein